MCHFLSRKDYTSLVEEFGVFYAIGRRNIACQRNEKKRRLSSLFCFFFVKEKIKMECLIRVKFNKKWMFVLLKEDEISSEVFLKKGK